MDDILSKASNQVVSFAIRSGFSIASGFALKTVSKLLDKVPESQRRSLDKQRLALLKKVTVFSQTTELIQISAARGNSILDSTLALVADLQSDISQFDSEMKELLDGIDQAISLESVRLIEKRMDTIASSLNELFPILNLALSTSGVNLSNVLLPRLSPSRLLQASNYLDTALKLMENSNLLEVRVGPTFDIKLFSVFYNPSRLKYVTDDVSSDESKSVLNANTSYTDSPSNAISWKEEYARAEAGIYRTRGDLAYQYELRIEEDFEDGRYHGEDEESRSKVVDIIEIEKLFFGATGALLRLENSNSPVVVLKVRTKLGIEYMALGEASLDIEDFDSDDSESEEEAKTESLEGRSTQLSLLQYLMRLASMERQEQCSALEVKDEILSFYLQNETINASPSDSENEGSKEHSRKQHLDDMVQMNSNINRMSHLSVQDESSKKEASTIENKKRG